MDPIAIFYISVEVILGTFGAVGNLVVLIAISKTKELHTITNLFIGNLAVADIAMGLFVSPASISSYLGYPHDGWGCIFVDCIILMFSNTSVFMILGIAIDRFVAIRYPFFYHMRMNTRLASIIIMSLWLTGILIGSIPMFVNSAHRDVSKIKDCAFEGVITMQFLVFVQFFVVMLIPLLVMTFTYIYIINVIKRHRKQINRSTVYTLNDGINQNQTDITPGNKVVKMFNSLIVLFVVFWLPSNLLNLMALLYPPHHIPEMIFLVSLTLHRVNSCFNPFLYAGSNTRIKRALMNVLMLPTPDTTVGPYNQTFRGHTLCGKDMIEPSHGPTTSTRSTLGGKKMTETSQGPTYEYTLSVTQMVHDTPVDDTASSSVNV